MFLKVEEPTPETREERVARLLAEMEAPMVVGLEAKLMESGTEAQCKGRCLISVKLEIGKHPPLDIQVH